MTAQETQSPAERELALAWYEASVQAPADLVRMLRALAPDDATVIGEDFCGTAAIARAWLQSDPSSKAVAVDRDRRAISFARRALAEQRLSSTRLEFITGDVIADTDPKAHAADLIHCGNFSILEWHTRRDLVAYLAHARSRLRRGGVFVCDIYGGESAFAPGEMDREFLTPDGQRMTYVWEQRTIDPLTMRVSNAIHFVRADGSTLPNAFVYDWRLWSVAEMCDAFIDAGFAPPAVHQRTPDAIDDDGKAWTIPLAGEDIDTEGFDVLIVGRLPGDDHPVAR